MSSMGRSNRRSAARPWDRSDDDAVDATLHPWSVCFKQDEFGRCIECAPLPTTRALVVAGTAIPAVWTPVLVPMFRSNFDGHSVLVLVEFDAFHDESLDAKQPPP